jgi:hypothetical protein
MTSVIRTATAMTRRVRKSRIPPLQWWRGQGEPRLDRSAVEQLRDTLDKVYLLAFPRWPLAVRGDGGAAALIGIYVASDPQSPAWLADLVGSALLLCAAEGSDGAGLVLRHLRRRHGRTRQPTAEA